MIFCGKSTKKFVMINVVSLPKKITPHNIMTYNEVNKRQIFIIDRLRIKKEQTLDEILEYLNRKSGFDGSDYNISKRTFHRDVAEIKERYRVFIKYNNSTKVWYIEDDENEIAKEQLLEAYHVWDALSLHEANRDFMFLEKRRAAGTEHLKELLHAIKKQVKVAFTYQKYDEEQPEHKVVKPLALKVYRYRWYLIAVDVEDRRYALDRISDLETLNERFEKDPNLNIHEIQKYCFGISVAKDYCPQKIVLSFDPTEGKYAKSLPWHDSQEILIDNKKELRISLYIYPTEDFKRELLSSGSNVKVIEPQSLADEMKAIYKDALKRYR